MIELRGSGVEALLVGREDGVALDEALLLLLHNQSHRSHARARQRSCARSPPEILGALLSPLGTLCCTYVHLLLLGIGYMYAIAVIPLEDISPMNH